MNASDLQAIRQIIREEVRAVFGNPIAQTPSLDQRAIRDHENKARELAEKRAKRAQRRI